jgi:hypothetical protein
MRHFRPKPIGFDLHLAYSYPVATLKKGLANYFIKIKSRKDKLTDKLANLKNEKFSARRFFRVATGFGVI